MKVIDAFKDREEEDYVFFVFMINKYVNKVLNTNLEEANEFLTKNSANKQLILPKSEDNVYIYNIYISECQSVLGTKRFLKLCKYIYYFLENYSTIDNYTSNFIEKNLPGKVFSDLRTSMLEILKVVIGKKD